MGLSVMGAERDEMRQRADWMKPPDDSLLEALHDEGT